jgi:hypothetical protein
MPPPLPSGTFLLHPYAEPPLRAGRYTLTGDVTGLPVDPGGKVRTMAARVDVVAPRFTLPPDQILGTYPPAGARGNFTSRLPQVVLRRRTLPWERSTDLDLPTAPTPWLALVLVAEGEGQLLSDVAVAQCVTPGTTVAGDVDVPKSSCLEIPEEVVERTFPTREDLTLLSHVRAVDLADTDLAMGDDDGWLAVVLGNRLPQPGVRYLACLISVEGQLARLPVVREPDLLVTYERARAVLDLRAEAAAAYGPRVAYDTAVMKLPGSSLTASTSEAQGPARPERSEEQGLATGEPGERLFVASATGEAAPVADAWATGPAPRAASAAYVEAAGKARKELADGWSVDLGVVTRPMLRFPVLAYWSFACEERGDFQYLAEHVHVRLLGHVTTGPETPDGDPVDPDAPPVPGSVPEPRATRPLPLVAETGHVVLDHASRAGEPAPAWYRGPLTPLPVPRAEPRPDGRPPLAHHADQLRRVVPDGREDLGYAAAFEIGRLLALAQPGVVAAFARWRQDAYGAARVRELGEQAVAQAPDAVRELAERPDVLAPDEVDGRRPGTLGPRAVRAVAELLGDQGAAGLGAPRPVADPSVAAAELDRVLPDRDQGTLTGLGVAELAADDPAALLEQLASRPVDVGRVHPGRVGAALRTALEDQAAQQAFAAEPFDRRPRSGPGTTAVPEEPGEAGEPGPPERDALDELLAAAIGHTAGPTPTEPPTEGEDEP